MCNIHPKAEPFFLKGDAQVALLFIHGFTASPSELYPLAELINNMTSCSVSGILLPGHGTTPQNLSKTTWQQGFAAVEKETRYLLDRYEKVFVAGLSMGGLLAIYAGIHIRGLSGVVSINAPVFNKSPVVSALAPVIQIFRPLFAKKENKQRLKLKKQGRFAYDCTPVKAFRSMGNLRNRVIEDISSLTIPLLVMQSKLDESVNPESGIYLVEKAVNAPAALVHLEKSFHIATMGEEKDIIASEIAEFITNFEF
ncbi:MAG: alpha/beta fold hydrolase [Syntrophomonadaceae bacterium]|nr:alpha/beta fold hydrolase [Syntrophomonadaceae bacterium]MDD3889235.1 alpha/beta fold hydrolase [Syntrophomonadaceae bacterium]MDD4549769.1 alpha/beta fold hydrolase [Syntrophomonadaceae bacterium]